jgi:hypothetical protein
MTRNATTTVGPSHVSTWWGHTRPAKRPSPKTTMSATVHWGLSMPQVSASSSDLSSEQNPFYLVIARNSWARCQLIQSIKKGLKHFPFRVLQCQFLTGSGFSIFDTHQHTPISPGSEFAYSEDGSSGHLFVHIGNPQHNYSTATKVPFVFKGINPGIVFRSIDLNGTAQRMTPEVVQTIPPDCLPAPLPSGGTQFLPHPSLGLRSLTLNEVLSLPHYHMGHLFFSGRPIQRFHGFDFFRYSSNILRIISDTLRPLVSAIVRRAAIWERDRYRFIRCIYTEYTSSIWLVNDRIAA